MFAAAISSLPVTAVEIADFAKKDKVLVKVYEYTFSGWPNHCLNPVPDQLSGGLDLTRI